MGDIADSLIEGDWDCEPYDVTCARCGKVLSCDDANLEEGDEWECWPCADRCNAAESKCT